MTEYLDYYTEDGEFLGTKSRKEVHNEGLWHNTVHCWLYTSDGKIMFQIRKDTNTFYTTASGHVLSKETVQDAFNREIREEIGLNVDASDATLVNIVTWRMDKELPDGSLFIDRAKANVYIDLYEGNFHDFIFDLNEVLGIALVDAKETMKLFNNEVDEISAQIIGENNDISDKKVTVTNFLINKNETAIGKYGEILNKVIDVTN